MEENIETQVTEKKKLRRYMYKHFINLTDKNFVFARLHPN